MYRNDGRWKTGKNVRPREVVRRGKLVYHVSFMVVQGIDMPQVHSELNPLPD